MNTFTIEPTGTLRGTLTMPGDKSITHRAIMMTALAHGTSEVSRYGRGEDCLNTMRAFQAMGIDIAETPERLTVHGKGLWGLREPTSFIDCGNSGTGIRLMAGLLAGQEFFTVLTGDESIRRRPMGRVVRPLREMGATIAGRRGGELAPLAITGTRLRGLDYRSPVASAQVKSSVLLAGLTAEGTTRVTEPRQSRDHTERIFRYFGVPCRVDETSVSIEGRPSAGWQARSLSVPGDFSAAAFFLVAGTIVGTSDILIEHVGVNPTRTGLLTILRRMGAQIEVLNPREEGGEPVADLRVRPAALTGTTVRSEEIAPTIDEFPILCVAAAVAVGDTTIAGAEELRVKESDRIATMATELRKMGVGIEERPDGMVIHGIGGTKPLIGNTFQSYGDHRVAMSMSVAALVADRPSTVQDTECVATSFPGFMPTLASLLTGRR